MLWGELWEALRTGVGQSNGRERTDQRRPFHAPWMRPDLRGSQVIDGVRLWGPMLHKPYDPRRLPCFQPSFFSCVTHVLNDAQPHLKHLSGGGRQIYMGPRSTATKTKGQV
jgi:hypothetical protein